MNSALRSASTLFATVDTRYRPVLKQLQYHADLSTPFMCLLSNRVASSLEMPSISTDNNESSANIYGTRIAYRGHSYKSNECYSFTLSFKDSKYLEVYMLAKLYDEYHTLMKLGYIQPKTEYIENRILDEENEDLRSSCLSMTKLVLNINLMLLDVLGINCPDKM